MNYKLIMASLFVAANVNAKVTLPKMFSDGMVMQRETTANVWGLSLIHISEPTRL